MSERTLAVTWGRWGGVYFAGSWSLCWRLCLGFVAITYVRAEMTELLDTWLEDGDQRDELERWRERTRHLLTTDPAEWEPEVVKWLA